MSRTLLGLVTFGNPEFTRLALREARATATRPLDSFVIAGQPGDEATPALLRELEIPFLAHAENRGFPASLNDLMDYAFGREGPGALNREAYDHLIFMGSDVVPYPGAIDALIEAAEQTNEEWFSACQYDVRALCRDHPEARAFFTGEDYRFTDFSARPWELHANFHPPGLHPGSFSDVRNLALCKRSVFEKVGYADANFWPGGYFEDNDYQRRALLLGVRACTLPHAAYFHFWSRTIKQGSGSTQPGDFARNQQYYEDKWGGPYGRERWPSPFNGSAASRAIHTREDETSDIHRWASTRG